MFIYACAYTLSRSHADEPIVLCGSAVDEGICDSLFSFPLRNVKHALKQENIKLDIFQKFFNYVHLKVNAAVSREALFDFERRWSWLYQKTGLFYCQDGYVDFQRNRCRKHDIMLKGYFQCPAFFDSCDEEVKVIFRDVPLKSMSVEKIAFGEAIEKEDNPVCLAMRFGDYVKNPLHGVCTADYYLRAIKSLCEQVSHPRFFVFTNDSSIARTVLDRAGISYCIEPKNNSDRETLFFMSRCRHFIISNSSFHWWGQYLSRFRDKIVIAPSRWYAQPYPCFIMENGWQLIEC